MDTADGADGAEGDDGGRKRDADHGMARAAGAAGGDERTRVWIGHGGAHYATHCDTHDDTRPRGDEQLVQYNVWYG